MKQSTDRIITTHAGSLARPQDLLEMLRSRAGGEQVDEAAFAARAKAAVTDVVRRQAEIGIDVVTDGEQSKPSFQAYVTDRLTGFETRPGGEAPGSWAGTRERLQFPEYYSEQQQVQGVPLTPAVTIVCTGPITYRGQAALQTDIANLKSALQGLSVAQAFMPSISVNNIEAGRSNEYYKTNEEFLQAIADAMREEYRAIVEAGLVLQVDDPRFSTQYNSAPDWSLEQTRRWMEQRAELVNYSLKGIAPEMVRFHTCYSIDMGPRLNDMPLKDLVDIMLKINAGAYSFETANPRHDHEYHVWEAVKLPAGKVLIPGVISHTTNLIEHPELVAERIVRYAKIVGRENMIAGADCGFAATARTRQDVHPTVAWEKLRSLVEGAALASKELW
ncbi:MAG TPA: cobalamin-independent methionine synthase II family protein [Dehalococcoidia bacterium]|nr:cobalamin-independent methionine synthase II family protein [Dehalococcoidia bacterium]